jgi:hypothetical protein
MRVKRADVVGYSRNAGGHTRTHPSVEAVKVSSAGIAAISPTG